MASAQPLATGRGLKLLADGPPSFRIETDPIILYRIAQNLLRNALLYSTSGGVPVSWSRETDFRWILSVQDAGPDLPPGLVTLFAKQLKPTVEPTAIMGRNQAGTHAVKPSDEPISLPNNGSPVNDET